MLDSPLAPEGATNDPSFGPRPRVTPDDLRLNPYLTIFMCKNRNIRTSKERRLTRIEPPLAAPEKDMLLAFLNWYRATMIEKLSGLTPEQVRFTPAPTANGLLGLVSHLAFVEHWWFQVRFLDEPEMPQRWGDPDDQDWDFHVPDDRTTEEIIAWYREECARSNEIARVTDLDAIAARTQGHRRDDVTMRWILIHMIEETARHAGHADITRELVDGLTGQ